jgi:hypothetical protein
VEPVIANMEILAQFLLRLSFGLAVGIAITSSRRVSSGYFRNNLYVMLGLTTLAAMALSTTSGLAAGIAAAAALLCFLGSACWLYDSKQSGSVVIWAVAGCSLLAAWMGIFGGPSDTDVVLRLPAYLPTSNPNAQRAALVVSTATSGLVLGVTFAAMLLGHWYLNSPGMELAPLRRLITAAAVAVAIQSLVSAVGLGIEVSAGSRVTVSWLLFVVLRWSFGLVGVAVLLWMARQTLKIPNTQSATGILYVAVIGVFVGELTGLLLSAESAFPL